MSVNTYDKNADELNPLAGRVAGAYTKAQTDAKIDANNSMIVGGDEWVQRTYVSGEVCIHNNKVWTCVADTNTEPSESNSNWRKTDLKSLSSFNNNRITTAVELAPYKAGNNLYTFPTDGYVQIWSTSGAKAIISLYGANDVQLTNLGMESSVNGYNAALFVKKGMKVGCAVSNTGSWGAWFYSLY